MKKIHQIFLTKLEIDELSELLHKGKHPSRRLNRARILLLAHQGKSDLQIAEQVGVCKATVYHVRRRFCEEDNQSALNEKPRSGQPIKLHPKAEAYAIALACSQAPEG